MVDTNRLSIHEQNLGVRKNWTVPREAKQLEDILMIKWLNNYI